MRRTRRQATPAVSPPRLPPVHRIAWSLLLIIGCATVLALASLRAAAAWQLRAAERLAAPALEAGAGDPGQLASALAHLDRALAFRGADADVLDLASRLRHLQATRPGVAGAERRRLLQAAAHDQRRALALKPLWPYGWAELLQIKADLGEIDGEFRRALRRSTDLGPGEPPVQLAVLDGGLRHWPRLGASDQEVILVTLDRALRMQSRETGALIRRHGRQDLLCNAPGAPPHLRAECPEP